MPSTPSATAPTPSAGSSPPAFRAEPAGAAAARAATPARDPGFGVYVHWPFCLSKCPYCDFNSHVRAEVDEGRWRDALLAELHHVAAETGGRRVTSVFFGGGTPSLMAPATAAAVIAAVRALWPRPAGDPEPEITLEANPAAAEAERFAAFAEAGVNRLSVGVQALDDAALAFLGRRHSVAEALAALDRARRAVPRYSFDLIYGRPGQRVAAWREELSRALAEAGDHLSVYQLTIEPGTAFHTAWRQGTLAMPDEGRAAALYDATQEILERAGMPAYEVSNHARPGGECRHNLTYWRYGDYLGIGPGAHGRITAEGRKLATRRLRLPEAWLAAVERQGHGTAERAPIGARERAEEMLMMGLRLREGVDLARFREETGHALAELVPAPRLARLVDGGFLAQAPGLALRATAAGRLRLDAVLRELLA